MKVNEVIVTAFFLGWIPLAPGTVASLFTAVFFYFFLPQYNFYSLAIIILIISFFGLIAIRAYTKNLTEKDTSEIVIDEVIGQLIALLPLLIYHNHISNYVIFVGISFILFRLFDICKPPPIRYFDKINQAWAIIFDDCLAGLFAAVVIVILFEILIQL